MNIAVAQSGGPTCAINASLLGVFRQALKEDSIQHVFGSINGIEGVFEDNLVDLNAVVRTNEEMDLLRQTPSTVLGSCRYKLPEPAENEEIYRRILACFERRGIGAFFYIGGNDSMDTVNKLHRFMQQQGKDIKVIGIPKTIDNDLEGTDHTPGFGSAAKYVAATVQEIIRDSSVYSIESVTIIEVMGRHAGWLTASTSVLRANGEVAPHLIYLPESDFSVEKFLTDIRTARQLHKAVIVAVSEGVKLKKSEADFDPKAGLVDVFGHEQLSGIGKTLEKIVFREIGCKVRSIELNVMQRCSSHISSMTDVTEAEEVAVAAVKAAVAGESGKMMAFRRIHDTPYTVRIEAVDVSKVANREKKFPKAWINAAGNQVQDEAIPYFLPLIQGEQIIRMKNGIPIHYHI